MKSLLSGAIGLLLSATLAAQSVSQQEMRQVYDAVKTPCKYGMVLAPQSNEETFDCPTVFREGHKWYMTYVRYDGKIGKSGRGYETWIAESDDLLQWRPLGRLLSYRNGFWDQHQRGGFPALPDMKWGGSYELQKFNDRYWMTYIGGNKTGYESMPLNIGVAWTTDKPSKPTEWNALEKPILATADPDVQWWETKAQYKSCIYWDKKKRLGHPFVMYYNSNGKHPDNGISGERMGIALSDDMIHWKRYPGNPVFSHEINGTITGDAHIQQMGNLYVMFYFGAFMPDRVYKAHNTFAVSRDLIHWTNWTGDDLIIPSERYDDLFAHKSYVIKHKGVVYHFYCAVNQFNQRGIAVATSRPMGRSSVSFPQP